MGSFYGISMPDDQWRSMSAEDRLKYLSSHGGPTGNFVDAMQRSRAEHPNWDSPNYFDAVLGAMAKGGGRIPAAHVPGARSGLGMMSGDAGADIARATADTTANYGPDPRLDRVPPAVWDEASAAKQRARVGDWMTRLGEAAGAVSGTTDAYVPGAGAEWASIEGYDPTTGQIIWSPRRRR